MTQPADDDTPVTVHASDFTRWPELVNYAQTRGITLNQAIIQLVNSGLSHL